MNKRTRIVLLVLVLLLVTVFLSGCGAPHDDVLNKPNGFWESIIVRPLVLSLIFLNDTIKGLGISYSWGWAIIVFTLIVKLVTLPLTLKQLQSTKATQALQPKLSELQAKYGKDKQKLSEEQMKLYKEAGVNPLGGCLPLVIQMPILIGLYSSLSWLAINAGMLKEAGFFWIADLSFPNQEAGGIKWLSDAFTAQDWGKLVAYMSLPLIMLVSQLVLQKMSQPVSTGPKTSANDQTQMMGQMMMFMPIFFGYITLGLPSGLTLYWTASNLLQTVQQYFITGWGSLGSWIPSLQPKPKAVMADGAPEASSPNAVEDKPKRRRRRK